MYKKKYTEKEPSASYSLLSKNSIVVLYKG